MTRTIVAACTLTAVALAWIALWPVQTVNCVPPPLLAFCPRPANVLGAVLPGGSTIAVIVVLLISGCGFVAFLRAGSRTRA